MGMRSATSLLALASLLTACGGRSAAGGFHPSGDASAPGTGAVGSISPGSATDSRSAAAAAGASQSALAAYRRYQSGYETAYETNDASVLNAVAMDPLLAQVSQDVADVRAKGLIWRFHNVLNPGVQGRSKDGSAVVILDCVHTLGAYKFDAKTGKRLNAWRGGSRQYQAIMRFAGNTWKISDARQGGKC